MRSHNNLYNIIQYALLPVTCRFYMKSKGDQCRGSKSAIYKLN